MTDRNALFEGSSGSGTTGPSFDTSPGSLEGRLMARLAALRRQKAEDPGFNPIWRLASDLSFAIADGALETSALCAFSGHLLTRSLEKRGERLGRFTAPLNVMENAARIEKLIREMAGSRDFLSFAAACGRPVLGIVFTAHPTFLLSSAEAIRVLDAARQADGSEGAEPCLPGGGDAISLDDEHRAAMAAIAHAREGIDRIHRILLAEARSRYPGDWHRLQPCLFDLATWVGYDMDGRTDIGWADCIRLRLTEKVLQLRHYAERVAALGKLAGPRSIATVLDEIGACLARAEALALQAQKDFSGPLEETDVFIAAADRLSADHPDRLTDLAPILERLADLLREADRMDGADGDDGTLAIGIASLMAEMRLFGLGVGRVHFRINATQLHNAVRRRLESGSPVDLASRSALVRLNDLYEESRPLKVNFAALGVETTTAVRQFLTIAQILKHIDAASDIRLLIAECERPVTVLAALYLAKLFGVVDRIDVSPLFETPAALEGGERFLDVLFAQPAWRDAAMRRGRIAIQTGFSDAGRFIGQIPASLSIERLHANLARLVEKHGLSGLECLIFNTHGESMGRGAHPCSLRARLDHAMTPWARRQFAERGIALRPEASFQGGDGYLRFADPGMAFALLARILERSATLDADLARAGKDPFYDNPDIALDFFRRTMRFNEALLASPAYHRTLTAFGLSLLPTTGSRKSRRQFEQGSAERSDISRVRAIPHNAVLQQLGYPVNVLGGIGQAVRSGLEPFTEWRHDSPRFSDLMDLAVHVRSRASLRTLIAYGQLFDGGYWAARPHGAGQAHLTDACLYLAERFERDDRHAASRELATRLRIDELLLHRLLSETGDIAVAMEGRARDFLALLHAVRIALIQHLFLLGARIPRFSARNDVGREDIMALLFELRIPEAVALLREAYPLAAPRVGDFALAEPTEYPDEAAMNYADINRRFIDPMEILHRCLLGITVAIANVHDAFG